MAVSAFPWKISIFCGFKATSRVLAGFHRAVIKFHLFQIRPFFHLLLIAFKRLIFKKTLDSAPLIEKISVPALFPSPI